MNIRSRQFLIYLVAVWCVLILSCSGNQEDNYGNEADKINLIRDVEIPRYVVDYKTETYNIALGETYKVSDKLIDWRWSGEIDPDDTVDSTGIDTFHSLSEPLISYDAAEWLPALHIQTSKNVITSFSCSILFSLSERDSLGDEFLRILDHHFTRLQNDTIVNLIISEGLYTVQQSERIAETYQLIKANGNGYDVFEYHAKIK
ncbi:MAG: hypothetical protein AB8B72_04790 [Crocinitomicaceae bacterium]